MLAPAIRTNKGDGRHSVRHTVAHGALCGEIVEALLGEHSADN